MSSKYPIIEDIRSRAALTSRRIVFPESQDSRVLKAVETIAQEGIAQPVLLGNSVKIRETARSLGLNIEKVETLEPAQSEIERYAGILFSDWRVRGTT